MTTWPADVLVRIAAAAELDIAVQRPDGTFRRPTPIWVVTVAEQVYVRSWHRRDTGWFGAALVSTRARIRVPGAAADVTIIDIGDRDDRLRTAIDTAYSTKYGATGAASMVTSAAAATTLQIIPVGDPP